MTGRLRAIARSLWARITGREPEPERLGRAHAPERLLLVANAYIPTLQLSFVKPLAAPTAAGAIALTLLTEKQIKDRYGAAAGAASGREHCLRVFQRSRPTAVVFCRYSGPHGEALVAQARAAGVPTLFHIDDDLLAVPPELGAAKHAFHNRPERLAAVRHLLAQADLVYCSTAALRERLERYGLGAPCQAGAIYCAGTVRASAPDAAAPRRFGYMGFDHAHDFALIVPGLVDVLDADREVEFELFGAVPKPPELERYGERVRVLPPVHGYEQFLATLTARRWSIGLCPLARTPFNALKADTKWVEYTSVGAAVVASRGTVYDHCCAGGTGLLADTRADWRQAILGLLRDPVQRMAMVENAQARLEHEYSVTALRAQVLGMLEQARACARPRRVA